MTGKQSDRVRFEFEVGTELKNIKGKGFVNTMQLIATLWRYL